MSYKITVCVLTYNRYKDLENLIKSYLTLTYANSDLLIIDDLGSPQTEETVKRWQKKDNRIKYHKNPKNLGFFRNLKQSYKIAKGNFIVFMGDDDIFLDTKALDYIAKAFENKSVGVVKGAQLLYKHGELNQVYPIPPHTQDITLYKKGLESYRKLWFESLSITGLGFRITNELFDALNDSPTLYPQVEHMGVMCLTYDSASINKYIVGVQSHEGQLNCISYYLDDVKTNLIEDWVCLYKRIEQRAKKENKEFISYGEFKGNLAKFVPLFFPYNRLTNGWINTLQMITKTLLLDPTILLNVTFLMSSGASLILPKDLLRFLIESIKQKRLKGLLSEKEISAYNKLLQQYY